MGQEIDLNHDSQPSVDAPFYIRNMDISFLLDGRYEYPGWQKIWGSLHKYEYNHYPISASGLLTMYHPPFTMLEFSKKLHTGIYRTACIGKFQQQF